MNKKIWPIGRKTMNSHISKTARHQLNCLAMLPRWQAPAIIQFETYLMSVIILNEHSGFYDRIYWSVAASFGIGSPLGVSITILHFFSDPYQQCITIISVVFHQLENRIGQKLSQQYLYVNSDEPIMADEWPIQWDNLWTSPLIFSFSCFFIIKIMNVHKSPIFSFSPLSTSCWQKVKGEGVGVSF